MTEIRFNKENWTGDVEVAKKTKKGLTLSDGTKIAIKKNVAYIDGEADEDIHIDDLSHKGVANYQVSNYDRSVSRENADPLIALAQLYFNIY